GRPRGRLPAAAGRSAVGSPLARADARLTRRPSRPQTIRTAKRTSPAGRRPDRARLGMDRPAPRRRRRADRRQWPPRVRRERVPEIPPLRGGGSRLDRAQGHLALAVQDDLVHASDARANQAGEKPGALLPPSVDTVTAMTIVAEPRPASSGKHRPLFVKQHLEGGTRRYPLREASKLGPALRVRRDVDVAKMHETRDDRD